MNFEKFCRPICFLFLSIVSTSAVIGQTVEPLRTKDSNVINLSDYAQKKTYFELMVIKGGIKDSFDRAYDEKFEVAGRGAMIAGKEKFTPKVFNNVVKEFSGSRQSQVKKFEELVDSLEGKSFSQRSLKTAISKRGLKPWSIVDFLAMVSGSMVFVRIDDDNYFYNVSYDKNNVNAGRSFGAGPSHLADDASYPFYLRNFRLYLDETEDLSLFYEAIMKILTASDPSGVANIPVDVKDGVIDGRTVKIDGQTMATDFLTIYTAELYRHVNSNLERHDWENALAELTFLAAFSESAGVVHRDGVITKGNVSDWRYEGPEGSGIGGKSGIERRKLQRKVCTAARKMQISALKAIESITGKESDCFRGIMTYLNNYETKFSKKNAQILTRSVVSLLSEIRNRHEEVLQAISGAEN